MGDRTYVTLTVPKELEAEARQIIELSGEESENDDHDDEWATFGFSEVNYGELSFLKNLQAAGIAYNSHWCAGSEYTEGTEYCRFTEEGELQLHTVYEDELGVSLHTLLPIIDDHEKLKAAIRLHERSTVPLPWENQVEYGKRFRAAQLINPTQPRTEVP